ncbi:MULTISPECIES: lipoprotein [Pseudomonadaceae]|uniref:lipoprotein n=1 Tax=Pseudomonadaceae TaxID=135621 RepID=UPI000F784A35|nr:MULTISPECIES: lipoprotein [Pseudomonas]MDH0959122.1 lipoprotein [Pseudomonas chengduensis]MDV5863570.1 lipoprotein [Pseudomonas mendocina]RRV31684.1 hypothetical protein EGJ86_19110 [Pseudomonas sp. o96-267]UTH34327.1 lipoprotein [Pseudomonas hydrolytica]UZZ13650.1 lipoprotein [Pseudomonas mendocina]
MKKLFIAALAVVALAGCKEEGGAFVGQWKNNAKMPETITVTEASGGYRAVAQIDEDKKGYMNVEVVLKAESDKLLVRDKDGKRALEIAADGKMTSYLRHGKDDTFTKVN